MKLAIRAKGATESELKRGASAAQSFFDSVGVNPWLGAAARFKLEGEQEELTEEEN